VTSIDVGLDDELVPEVEAAHVVRQKPATLTTWRWQRRGPPFVKLGRRVFYRRGDLHAWIAAQRHEPDA
jgi:hypothetical protein